MKIGEKLPVITTPKKAFSQHEKNLKYVQPIGEEFSTIQSIAAELTIISQQEKSLQLFNIQSIRAELTIISQ